MGVDVRIERSLKGQMGQMRELNFVLEGDHGLNDPVRGSSIDARNVR